MWYGIGAGSAQAAAGGGAAGAGGAAIGGPVAVGVVVAYVILHEIIKARRNERQEKFKKMHSPLQVTNAANVLKSWLGENGEALDVVNSLTPEQQMNMLKIPPIYSYMYTRITAVTEQIPESRYSRSKNTTILNTPQQQLRRATTGPILTTGKTNPNWAEDLANVLLNITGGNIKKITPYNLPPQQYNALILNIASRALKIDNNDSLIGPPDWLVDENNKLKRPVTELLSAAFGFNKNVMRSTNLVKVSNRTETGGHDALTIVKRVNYVVEAWMDQQDDYFWFSEFVHELVHRHQWDLTDFGHEKVSLDFFGDYGARGVEIQAYQYGGNSTGVSIPSGGVYADQLWKYKEGIIPKILIDQNMSDDDKGIKLYKIGKKFYRDVILQDQINNTQNEIDNLEIVRVEIMNEDGEAMNMKLGEIDRYEYELQIQIYNLEQEQNLITKKYGE